MPYHTIPCYDTNAFILFTFVHTVVLESINSNARNIRGGYVFIPYVAAAVVVVGRCSPPALLCLRSAAGFPRHAPSCHIMRRRALPSVAPTLVHGTLMHGVVIVVLVVTTGMIAMVVLVVTIGMVVMVVLIVTVVMVVMVVIVAIVGMVVMVLIVKLVVVIMVSHG